MSALFCGIPKAWAAGSAGIEIGLDSARAVGKANAVVADPQDASTLATNPAGMAKLKGNEMAIGYTTIVPGTGYTSVTGESEDASSRPASIPSFFMSFKTPIEHLSVGGGVHAPFGLETQYSSEGHFKYTGIFNQVLDTSYLVSASYEIAPWLSVGGGASYIEADVKQISKLNSSFISSSAGLPAVLPDANVEADMEGHGYGWNVGVLLTPDEKIQIGFFYRSSVRVPLRGQIDVDNIQGFIPQFIFGGESFNTSLDSDVEFPDSAVVGFLYHINDQWDVEADLGWTGWEKFDHFDLAFGTSNAVLDAADPSGHQFDDSISVNVGFDCKVSENWNLLFGYAFFEQAAQEEDYSNTFPDGDRHAFTVGVQYRTGPFSIAMAYAGQFVDEVSVDNTVGNISGVSVDGDYSGFYHIVVGSMTYRFG
ncbi:MAG: OmpP1/FadL family transporter [Candidatus Omnitrophota bacterium]